MFKTLSVQTKVLYNLYLYHRLFCSIICRHSCSPYRKYRLNSNHFLDLSGILKRCGAYMKIFCIWQIHYKSLYNTVLVSLSVCMNRQHSQMSYNTTKFSVCSPVFGLPLTWFPMLQDLYRTIKSIASFKQGKTNNVVEAELYQLHVTELFKREYNFTLCNFTNFDC